MWPSCSFPACRESADGRNSGAICYIVRLGCLLDLFVAKWYVWIRCEYQPVCLPLHMLTVKLHILKSLCYVRCVHATCLLACRWGVHV